MKKLLFAFLFAFTITTVNAQWYTDGIYDVKLKTPVYYNNVHNNDEFTVVMTDEYGYRSVGKIMILEIPFENGNFKMDYGKIKITWYEYIKPEHAKDLGEKFYIIYKGSEVKPLKFSTDYEQIFFFRHHE